MNTKLAELIVSAIVLVWLFAVVVAVVDPGRADVAGQIAPIVGTIAGAAVAVLTLRKKNGNGNGSTK